MNKIKVTEAVVQNKERGLYQQTAGGWFAFYRNVGGNWASSFPLNADLTDRRWDLCPAPLHTTKEAAISSARSKITASGEIVVMEVRL